MGKWGEAEARKDLADQVAFGGASLVAMRGPQVIGIVAVLRELDYAGFRVRGIPLTPLGRFRCAIPAAAYVSEDGPKGDARGLKAVPRIKPLCCLVGSVGGHAGLLRAAITSPGEEVPHQQAADACPA